MERKKLKVAQWNARSIRKRTLEFKIFLYGNKPEIVAIQETWLKSKHKTPNFISYESIRKDRNNRPGGGIMLLIRNGIQYKEKP